MPLFELIPWQSISYYTTCWDYLMAINIILRHMLRLSHGIQYHITPHVEIISWQSISYYATCWDYLVAINIILRHVLRLSHGIQYHITLHVEIISWQSISTAHVVIISWQSISYYAAFWDYPMALTHNLLSHMLKISHGNQYLRLHLTVPTRDENMFCWLIKLQCFDNRTSQLEAK